MFAGSAADARNGRLVLGTGPPARPVPAAEDAGGFLQESASAARGAHPAARAALRASPLRPVTTRTAIEPSMRCIPGPTWWTAIT